MINKLVCIVVCIISFISHAAPTSEPYVKSSQKGREICLNIAARKFVSDKEGAPVVWLTGVVHIGDKAYYHALQKHLDEVELVLYEGVGEPNYLRQQPEDLKDAPEYTKNRMEFLKEKLTAYYIRNKSFPKNIEALANSHLIAKNRNSRWVRISGKDGWGKPILYFTINNKVSLVSMGSDRQKGGKGDAADIKVDITAPKELTPKQKDNSIQELFAKSLGLAFQLYEINYNQNHFVNSDMTQEQLSAITGNTKHAKHPTGDKKNPDNKNVDKELQKEMNEMMDIMQGKSFMGKMAKLMINLIAISPKMKSIIKVVLVEVLGEAGDDIEAVGDAAPGKGKLMKLIIHDRNKIVLNDLKKALKKKQPPKSISLFYGAGHMAGLEKSLIEELNYKPAETVWYKAFSVDLNKEKISDMELNMIRKSLKRQMNMLKEQKRKKAKKDKKHAGSTGTPDKN